MNTKPTNTPLANCNRQEDLVTFLYDEMSAAARREFETHLQECAACAAELQAFGRVREELGTWQVGLLPRTEVVIQRRKLDVLRELISLFPVWMRGAALIGAAAALVLVALSVLTLVKSNSQTSSTVAQTAAQPQATFTRAEVESLVKSEVAKAQSQMQQEFRAQLASFETQLNNDYQTRLQAVTSRVRSLETGKSRLIARDNRDESQIREWLADYRDTFGNSGNER